MKSKRVTIILSVCIVLLVGIIYIQNMRYNDSEITHKHNYGQQSFGIMMYVAGELRELTIKYESKELTTEDLEEYYNNMDKYILSIYNQEPTKFIVNIRRIRLTERYDEKSFNQETYVAYKELSDFLSSTYKEVEENYEDDEFLDYYNLYISEEFNENLSRLIENINNNE